MAASSSLLKSLSSLSLSTALPPSQLTLRLSSTSSPVLKIDKPQPLAPVIRKESDSHDDVLSVICPSLSYSNTLFFKSGYNVQVIVNNPQEPEESLIGRFRREVFKAGVIQESKRRMFFETTQEKRKRKIREAARRNRKRRPRPKVIDQEKKEKNAVRDEDDNWEFIDIEVPYCRS